MLIKYQPKNEHIKCVPLVPVTEEQKKLKLDRSQVQLLPGTNEVTDDEWNVMKTHLSREIARKEITTIEAPAAPGKGKKAVGGKAHNLTEVSSRAAVGMIADCLNPETLTKWYKEETREEVRLAIVEKMKELKIDVPKFEPEGKDDQGDDGEDGDTGSNGKSLDDMTLEELKAYAVEKNIVVSGNKAEILAAIKAAEGK